MVDAALVGGGVALFSPAQGAVELRGEAVRTVAVAVVFGLLGGLALAYFLALRRRMFTDPDEPELLIGAPLLAEIPDFKEERIKSPLAVRVAPTSAAAEAFRFSAASLDIRMQRAGADVEVYRYAGAGHLYTDPELPDYDAEATWETALSFLGLGVPPPYPTWGQMLSGSSRVFISLGSPMYIRVMPDGYAGADVNNPTDPNAKVYFDFVTGFEKYIILSTAVSSEAQLFPRIPGSYCQSLPERDPRVQLLRHTEAVEFLSRHGARTSVNALDYEQFVQRGTECTIESLDQTRLWPLRILYWFYVRRHWMHNQSIEAQHRRGWIKLPSEFSAEDLAKLADALARVI